MLLVVLTYAPIIDEIVTTQCNFNKSNSSPVSLVSPVSPSSPVTPRVGVSKSDQAEGPTADGYSDGR